MSKFLKSQLHHLVDTCENDLLLQEVKNILESSSVADWWEELPEKDKLMVMESEVEYKNGEFITHSQLKEQLAAWKKK
jgi:hypothetical protein